MKTTFTLFAFFCFFFIYNGLAQEYPKAISSNMKQYNAWVERASKSEDETTRKDYAKRASKYLGYAKKKAPDYNFTQEEQKITELLEGKVELSGKSFIRQQRGLMISYYSEGNFFDQEAFLRPKLLEDAKKFDRKKSEEEIAKNSNSTDVIVQDFKKMLTDYSDFIDRTKTRDFFMNKFNLIGGRADTKNPAYTLNEAKKYKLILEALQIFAGKPNETLNELNGILDEMIVENQEALKAIVTSDFHLANIGKVLFSNKPVTIGSESESDFRDTFEPGEAIYATMYLGRTLEAMFAGDAISKKGVHLTPLTITDSGYSAMGPNEGWEVNQFMAKNNICYPSSSLGQSYFQFMVIPDRSFNIKPYVDVSNYTPVTFMHGLSRTANGIHEFELKTNKPDRNGVYTEYIGTFRVDMSKKGGKEYYNTFKEEIIYEYIKNVPWPITPIFRDANLEAQAIKIMGDMIGDTQFKSARIVSNWDTKIVMGVKQRSIDIAVAGGKDINPNNPKGGYCSYRVYTFIDTGSGLQRKSSGPITRITCDKL